MEHLRITRLDVNEIGPFGQLALTFPKKPTGFEEKAEIHILTGENGTGKTTVLELLIGAIEPTPFLRSKFRHPDQASKFSVWFNSLNILATYLGENGEEFVAFDGSGNAEGGSKILNKYREALKNNEGFSTAFFAYSGYRKIDHKQLVGVAEITTSPMHGALDFAAPRDPLVLLQWILNLKTKAALSLSQNKLETAARYEASIVSIETAVEKIIGKPIRFEVETEPYDIKVMLDGSVFPFNNLPDGLKSIISWLADLLMRMDRVKWADDLPIFDRNFLLFLDEIEVHTHPAWQRKILPVLQGLFPNAQIFVSTHSPFVANSVDGAWIHRFAKDGTNSRIVGEPLLSEDGKSYSWVLEEVFNVPEKFGVGPTQQLEQFYQQRNDVLNGANGQTLESMLKLAKNLAAQGDELHLIVEMELRQINRRRQLSLSLD